MNTSDLLYEADRLNACWQALASMLCPDGELDRDKAAILMDYLSTRQAEILQQLYQAHNKAA